MKIPVDLLFQTACSNHMTALRNMSTVKFTVRLLAQIFLDHASANFIPIATNIAALG